MKKTDGIGRRTLLAAGSLGVAGAAVTLAAGSAVAQGTDGDGKVTETQPVGSMELARAVRAPTTPTGLAIAPDGRMFVFMPRFDDKTAFSIGEVTKDGGVTPWPDAGMNKPDPQRPQDTMFHVPNGVFDNLGRLWVLDAGLLAASGPPVPGAPKLVCFDLPSGAVLSRVLLGPGVVEPTSSLNDLRVDAGNGRRKAAYVTDQGQDGKGAIIAVDLATGRAVRRLARHSSTASSKGVLKVVEGRQLLKRGANGVTSEVQGGANGIALGPNGQRLYYAPLMGRHLYAVETDALLDETADDAAVAATVEDLGEKGLTGGLLADAQDRVYLSLQEHNAVGRREPDGTITVLACDPRMIWPDTFVLQDGWLYISSSQVNRRGEYNGGVDGQVPPYAVLRMRLA